MSARTRRREVNLRLDWLILIASVVAFSTGLVLLTQLHVGPGAFASSAWGVDKIIWLNVHRISAALVVLTVVVHVGLHWRVFRRRLTGVVKRGWKKTLSADLVMYVAFFVAALTSLVAWWVLDGSSPVFGPAISGHRNAVWHSWLDVHEGASLVALVLIVHHIKHRWRFMERATSAVDR